MRKSWTVRRSSAIEITGFEIVSRVFRSGLVSDVAFTIDSRFLTSSVDLLFLHGSVGGLACGTIVEGIMLPARTRVGRRNK